jgi:hypothetical protein
MVRTVNWTVRLGAIDAAGKTLETPRTYYNTISRDLGRAVGSDFGLKLSETKPILEQLQARTAQHQVEIPELTG